LKAERHNGCFLPNVPLCGREAGSVVAQEENPLKIYYLWCNNKLLSLAVYVEGTGMRFFLWSKLALVVPALIGNPSN